MKIIILSSAFSGLTQRVQRELIQLGHQVRLHIDLDEERLRHDLQAFKPALVLCPFLTQRIPEDVWRNWTCLVVHPGIEGDRGPSSLDWAIQSNSDYWGVTLLQADREMDAGNIWGTAEFPLRCGSKLSVYKREVSTAAMTLIKQAIVDFQNPNFRSRRLDYSNPKVKGTLRPVMKQTQRLINWRRDSTAGIVSRLNAGDTSPGVVDQIKGTDVHLYGAVEEKTLRGKAGDFIAITDEAVCRATIDGAVWIRQMKCKSAADLSPIKLPAALVLKNLLSAKAMRAIHYYDSHPGIDDIWVERRGSTAYVYFNCYNGAFSTDQCRRLLAKLQAVKQSNARFIVLMGGEDFWSNGINLNCIEAAADSAEEAWQNINAIDDVVLEIIDSPKQVTIAALRNNSGAGGSIMALACDVVIVREGTVHNPHYGNMGLYGSEYWTYLLPKKIGKRQAQQVIKACEPMLALEATAMGFADIAFSEDWDEFHAELFTHIDKLEQSMNMKDFIQTKSQQRRADEAQKPLALYRQEELRRMRDIFFDPSSAFHGLRRNFVTKAKAKAAKKQNGVAARLYRAISLVAPR